ncbi:hypothetical protein [Alteribacillus sp. HJP-4]|uniref:hypothetical protein n=1 Tax=Alteribacillus sp. HJP-4 TaxID=2775394 RepID=UPI0035CD3CDE
MNTIFQLLKMDRKHITRDPLLLLTLAAPLLMLALVKWALPLLPFSLVTKHPLILGALLLMTPLMIGLLAGFLMLEEKGQHLLRYYAVSPLRYHGYLFFRLLLPVTVSVFFSVVIIILYDTQGYPLLSLVPAVAAASLQAPVVMLASGSLAANKVEGLALSKLLNIILLLSAALPLFSGWWTYAAYFFPAAWFMTAFQTQYFIVQCFLFSGCLLVSLGWAVYFWKRLLRLQE